MKTVLTDDPYKAAEFISAGGIVAFPTETVYGLGADIFNPAAIKKIFDAKDRPADNPLIAHVAELSQINEIAMELNDRAAKFIEEFFPGALTIVLRKTTAVPLIATANLDSIGVRMPSLTIANSFLRACKTPIVAPSANLSGKPSPTTWQAVAEDLDGRIDCILRGEATDIGLESTVVDCTGEVPLLLRSGSVSLEDLKSIIPETIAYSIKDGEKPKSPGLRHKHYAPAAKVLVVEKNFVPASPDRAAYIGLDRPNTDAGFDYVKICGSVGDYAHSIFEFFRECDRRQIQNIYCESVSNTAIGAALMDRITRASEN